VRRPHARFPLPRIRDANNNRLVTKYAIHLYVDTGGVRLFDRFLVSDNLSVPCILGTEVIEQNSEAILPRLRKIVWQEHVRCTEELFRPTPILACLNDSAWDRHWQDKPARVRACKPGVGEDKSLEDISAQDTRIHPGYGLRLEARNLLNSEEEE